VGLHCVKHGRCVTTRELYRVCISRAREDYECFKCGKPIYRGDYYINEYIYGASRRYHLKCYDNPHVKIVYSEYGAELCRVD